MMNKNLNWQQIRALHKLYKGESVNKGKANFKSSFQNHPYVKHLYEKGYIKNKASNSKVYIKEELNDKYDRLYKREFTNEKDKHKHDIYFKFLDELKVDTNRSKLREYDIIRLMEIKDFWSNKDLIDLRNQVSKEKENMQGISLMFFKSSKYMAEKISLITAVEKLIDTDFSKKTMKRYLKPFHCQHTNPKITILCENFYFLKFPYFIENYEIELMYVGGYNVEKLRNIVNIERPIYYIGDWDYDGLIIFEKAKRIIDGLEGNKHKLSLITPTLKNHVVPQKISDTEAHHSSKWKNKSKPICGLTKDFYSKEQQKQIQGLIKADKWIEEEGNDLEKIIKKILK